MKTPPEDVLDIYVPGTLRCLQCSFEVVSQTIFARSGDVGMTRAQALNENEGEPCPNDGTPMVRVRWSDRAQDNYKAYVALMEEVIAIAGAEHLPGALDVLRAVMGKAGDAVDPHLSARGTDAGPRAMETPNLAAPARDQGWQPIASAPNGDETDRPVLVYARDNIDRMCFMVGMADLSTQGWRWFTATGNPFIEPLHTPTHWRALPTPPTQGGTEG